MATLIIGDFRAKQLKQCQKISGNILFNNAYLIEDSAEYNWFINGCREQFPHAVVDSNTVVFMLGFNDCVYSCTWKTAFNIDTIVSNYASAINKLMEDYPDIKFYVCSVNPIDNDYPYAEYSYGTISEDVLNKKITDFNNKIKSACNATFIDSNDYLNTIGFHTSDGVRYMQGTCISILSYLVSLINTTGGSSFIPRLVAPVVSLDVAEEDGSDLESYWISSLYGGLNPYAPPQSNKKSDSDTLPNSTSYAWGRFYEITGSVPTFDITLAPGQWYTNISDGYPRGQTPALGAIICWTNGDNGHIGVVEQINKDGSIVTSESSLNHTDYWWTTTRSNSDGRWGADANYVFQGFIYCPTTVVLPSTSLCTKNSYNISIDEMKPNAQYIWQYLSSRGWTINAVAGLLGNLQQESKMSPCIWEGIVKDCETIDTITGIHTLTEKGKNFQHGYGLTQWTPATKFFNWCNNSSANGTGGVLPYWEMDSQLKRIEAEVLISEKSWTPGLSQWIAKPKKGYDLSFNDFINSNKDAYWLAGAFAFCYERPARSTGTAAEQAALKQECGEYGTFWYNYLSNLPIQLNTFFEHSGNKIQILDIKLDKIMSTSANLHFLSNGISSCKYIVYKNSVQVKTGQLDSISSGVTNIILNDLIPNSSYKIILELVDSNNVTRKKELSFNTLQDLPKSVKSIVLVNEGLSSSLNSTFKLQVEKPEYIGYWKKNNCGYDKQLFVNNKCIKTKTVNSIKNLSETFTIKNEFDYECKTGDIIQIGIRVWVTDDNGNKLYDNTSAKTSEPICLLNSSIRVYLKID